MYAAWVTQRGRNVQEFHSAWGRHSAVQLKWKESYCKWEHTVRT